MDDLNSLLKAIITNPDDDLARLAFADRLDEFADSFGGQERLNAQRRAEFIRFQVAFAKIAEPEYQCVGPLAGGVTKRHHAGGTCIRCTDDAHCLYHEQERVEKNYQNAFFFFSGMKNRTYRRGFVEKWRGTAAEWLKVHKDLFWHPDQTAEVDCPACGGAGSVTTDPKRVGKRCRDCRGAGKLTKPRPCPHTAEPLREVKLTTDMGLALLDADVSAPGFLDTFDLSNTNRCAEWRALWTRKWPGLAISSPSVPLPAKPG